MERGDYCDWEGGVETIVSKGSWKSSCFIFVEWQAHIRRRMQRVLSGVVTLGYMMAERVLVTKGSTQQESMWTTNLENSVSCFLPIKQLWVAIKMDLNKD